MTLLIAVIALLNTSTVKAQRLINDMQTCQGLINFLEVKLKNSDDKYNSEDIKIVLNGLDIYDNYIQKEIITPRLLKFNQNDKKKADTMQKQVDTYKESIVKAYQKRFPQNQLYMDFAVSLNNCTQKAVPSGDDLTDMKTSFNKMLELIKKQ